MTLFCHPYFYKKFVTVIFTNVTVIFTIVTVLFTNVTVIFTNVTVFITKTDFDHLSPFLYTVKKHQTVLQHITSQLFLFLIHNLFFHIITISF